MTLNGISLKDGNGDSLSFTAQVYANAGECLRLDVTYENANLKMEVISPSGAIWRNDDRGTGNLYYDPLITAVADVKGYYTVVVNVSGGNQPVNSVEGFGLAYGRYYQYNYPNCQSPSYPF